MKKYFGTDGIRGVANTELTPELAFNVAKAGAYVLSKLENHTPTILVGKDTRISGDMLEAAMISGFCSFGANVKILGVIPTPAVAYLVKKYNADAGVVISASHNPYEFNGIKYFSNKGTKLDDSLEEEIEQVMESNMIQSLSAQNNKIGTYEVLENAKKDYIDFLVNCVNLSNKDIVVGIDCSNGATYEVADKVFTALGINHKIINNMPNGVNINKDCGSTHVENLRQFVLENELSLCLAFDGDGDRCLALDNNGDLVDGDKMLAILGSNLKRENKLNKNTIVSTIMSNIGFGKFTKENGITLTKTKVGDRYVLEEMQKNGYNLGGEQSGHIILLDYNPTGDGILTGIKLIETLSNERLSEVASKIKTYPQIIINAKVSNKNKYTFDKNEEILEKIQELENEFKDNGRVLIRASGTEPLVRVMIEGENQEYISKKAKELAEIIEDRLKD